MRAFWAFVKKEFYHINRDPRTLLILIGMPIIQIILFGFAITTEINDAKIAILDNSKDKITQEINNKLLSTKYFLLSKYLNSYEEIDKEFKKGEIKLAIVYEDNFGRKMLNDEEPKIQIITDATDINTANTLVSYVSNIILDYQKRKFDALPKGNKIEVITNMEFNPQLKGVFLFVPGTIVLILTLISALMTSISIAREKEYGSLEVLLVSPLKPPLIIIGKVLPYILLSLTDAVTILLLGIFVFGLPIRGNIILLMCEIVLFILTALSLGIFISTKVKTQQQALLISLLALMLPTVILSGFIYPIESLPTILKYISHIIPAKWFLIILRSIMIKGTDFSVVYFETFVLMFMVFMFLFLSTKSFKYRLE